MVNYNGPFEIEFQIKLFLDSKTPRDVMENLKWLTIRTFEGEIEVEKFRKLMKKGKITTTLLSTFYEKKVKTKRGESILPTILRFYYLVHVSKKIPWAMRDIEVHRILMDNIKNLSVTRDSVNGAFYHSKRGIKFQWAGEQLFGTDFSKSLGSMGRPTHIQPRDILLRLLLMAKDMGHPNYDKILKIYHGKSIGGNEFTFATNELYVIDKSRIRDLQPELREAVKLCLDRNIQKKWENWCKRYKK